MFEYKDKCGKYLAYLLLQIPNRETNIKMKNQDKDWAVSTEDKLNIFAKYYGESYTSDNTSLQVTEYFFSSCDPSIISLEEWECMDAPICLQEVMCD